MMAGTGVCLGMFIAADWGWPLAVRANMVRGIMAYGRPIESREAWDNFAGGVPAWRESGGVFSRIDGDQDFEETKIFWPEK